MFYDKDVDKELNFHGNSEIKQEPVRIRGAHIADGIVQTQDEPDAVTAMEAATRKAKQTFGAEFGASGGAKAKAYNVGVCKQLKHKTQLHPCTCIANGKAVTTARYMELCNCEP